MFVDRFTPCVASCVHIQPINKGPWPSTQVPFTWNNTIMKFYKLQTVVNIEVDRIALHVEKLLNNKG